MDRSKAGEMTGSKKKKKKHGILNFILNFLMLIFFLVCIGALFYPYILDQINVTEQQATVVSYDNRIRHMDPELKSRMLEEAHRYNDHLREHPTGFEPSEEELAVYNSVLDNGDGIMGHISIPNIEVELMIYHTVEEPVLQVGVGHLPGTSLPVGGKGTHCALSGHTGLTTATLFTNLDKLSIGDYFYITVLEDVLTYQIDDISVVLPWELEGLQPDPEEDRVTLITCTPYGVNSHRLLVSGIRVATPVKESSDEGDYGTYTIYTPVERRRGLSIAEYMALAGTVVLGITIIVFIIRLIRRRKREQKEQTE